MGPLQLAARSELSLAALSIDEVRDAALIWKSLTDLSQDAWFWHTWANMQFNLVAAQKYEARNLSFFVLQGGKPVGVVPLMVNRVTATFPVGRLRIMEGRCHGRRFFRVCPSWRLSRILRFSSWRRAFAKRKPSVFA